MAFSAFPLFEKKLGEPLFRNVLGLEKRNNVVGGCSMVTERIKEGYGNRGVEEEIKRRESIVACFGM